MLPSPEGLLQNGLCKSSFSITSKKVVILGQWINKKVQSPSSSEVLQTSYGGSQDLQM